MMRHVRRRTPFATAVIVIALGLFAGCATSTKAPVNQPEPVGTCDEPSARITVVIALSAVVPAGIVGHAGIAIEQQYYDFGPARVERFQRLQAFGSPAGPWWDDPEQTGQTDRNLDQVLADLSRQVHPEGSLIAIVRMDVSPQQAHRAIAYWQAVYAQMEEDERVYRLLGEQCASVIAAGIHAAAMDPEYNAADDAPTVPRSMRGMSPTRLYRHLAEDYSHTAGPNAGRPVDIALYHLRDHALTPYAPGPIWSATGMRPPIRVWLGWVRLRNVADSLTGLAIRGQ